MVPAATLAAISAISALAKAGGAAAGGYFAGQDSEEQRKLAKRKMLIDQQNREEDLLRDDARYADTSAANRRAELGAKPMGSLNFLTGITNLRQGLARPTSLDYLGYLTGG